MIVPNKHIEDMGRNLFKRNTNHDDEEQAVDCVSFVLD